VNLWGLTGVGKTSLVNRLVELIDFEDSYYRFDLGEKEGSFSFRDSLDELCQNNDTSPVIIALDEIQHSRTVSGPFRQEIENDKNRMIWEMIDSGRIQYVEWKRGLWSFEDLIYKLLHLLKAGVEVKKGIVVNNLELYCNEMKVSVEEGKRLLFVPEDEYETIIEFAGEQLGLYLKKDVEKILLSYSANDTILFLNKVLKIGKRPSIKNFTKALIFVLGNLDEAYTMSDNFSPDIDADEFNKLSQKITVPKIKRALQNRFRNEQIARLGNIHIIYPALDKISYQKIIENELTKYSQSLTNAFNFKVEFDRTIHETIYNEGVYPTQGVRPIFTSIHQVLKSKISFFYSEIFLKRLNVDGLHFSVSNKRLICDYQNEQKTVYTSQTEITTTLENVRQNKRDDLQAITAVHESGHTVLSIILLKTIPDVVYSITTDADSQGFVYSSFAWKYISRKELIPRVAMMLGGYVAEELVFGKENLTSGASSDIEKATEFLSTMFKTNGMGQTPIKYSIPIKEENDSYHEFGAIEEEIKIAIEEAKLLAEKTLKSEQKLLLLLSDFLSDNRMLRKNDIKRFVEKAISSNVDFIEDGDYLFYREHLKKQIKVFQVSKPSEFHFENVISLNKTYKD
jgi:cell division protease FtsH